jgi:NAD(P)-dependent dehydrogenase (short-subunit alcohol dehydrogenase family)
MVSTDPSPVLFVLGAGPGLGMSVAHRFGAEGYAVALVSRTATRHAEYLRSLADAGVEAAAFTADAADPAQLRAAVDAARALFGRIDVGYYGPLADYLRPLADGAAFTADAADPARLRATIDAARGGSGRPDVRDNGPAAVRSGPGDITRLDRAGAETALRGVLPAVDFASLLIPELIERGAGGLLFVGGLSSVVPMPPHGGFALWSAALRNYAITLHAALAPAGIYAGTIAIGGLIERGDIHKAMLANPDLSAGVTAGTLDPDELAETVWQLYTGRERAEVVVSVFAD